MKLLRWKYIVPRLLAVLTILLSLRFGLDPLVKWAIESSGEAALGAKVELADVKNSLLTGQVKLHQLAVANPQAPMRNLMEVGYGTLHLDVDALLHGRVVITQGLLSGLEFDTERVTSGALPESICDEIESEPSTMDHYMAEASQRAEKWFDEVDERLNGQVIEELQSPKRAEELQIRWPEKYASLQMQADALRDKGKEIQAQLQRIKANPLRNLEDLGELETKVRETDAAFRKLQTEITALPAEVENDRQQVLDAWKHDEELIRARLQVSALDGQGLSQTLLGETANQRLIAAVDWIRWARRQLPRKQDCLEKQRSRGTTILFTAKEPALLIQELQLRGFATLRGEQLLVSGTARHLTTEPHLHARPTTLQIKATGRTEFSLHATLDRRTELAEDRLELRCPAVELPRTTLRNADRLAILVSPGTATVDADLHLQEEKLAGTISFAQADISLKPELPDVKRKIQQVFSDSLSAIDSLALQIELAGTLQKPTMQLRSDLGPQIATGLNQSIKKLLAEEAEILIAQSQQKLDAQLEHFTSFQQEAQEKLMASVGENQQLFRQLASMAGGIPGEGKSRIVPQLGRMLDRDSIRK